jgi:pimeloyl-ACP methyl ester carboxylesterase
MVISKDSTNIRYRRMGRGPGVVVLHGTMSSGANHTQLAEALARAFTVFVPDRRTLGLRGRDNGEYSIQKEVEDLDALLAETGAVNVFGVSSGGIITLQAALVLPAIYRVAVYEPPLFADRSVPSAVLARYDREMARGKVAAALITAMKGAQMGPAAFNYIPRPLLVMLTNRMLRSQDGKPAGDYLTMKALAPLLHYDLQLVADMSGKHRDFGAIRAEVLLLGGSKSPAYLKSALDSLEKVLPQAQRVEFSGLDHAASWNTDIGGRPESVAEELRRFFA